MYVPYLKMDNIVVMSTHIFFPLVIIGKIDRKTSIATSLESGETDPNLTSNR